MKIHEIIKEKRIAKGLTQEQVASFLGVSTPAVNKWEKAVTYPDVTLLPALARLLDTDLNTLLSFQADLSREEIGAFLNELFTAADEKGLADAFQLATQKLREYPASDDLLLNTALALDGYLSMFAADGADGAYTQIVEELFARAAASENPEVRSHAKAVLASKCMQNKAYTQAEKLLGELPDEVAFDKKHLQANLYMAQEDWAKAARLAERKILSDLAGVQSALQLLMEIACKEERFADAAQIAAIAKQMVRLFGLWDFGAYMADFQYAMLREDAALCLAALEKMLPALQKNWDPAGSPLYRHISGKKGDENFGRLLLPLLRELEDGGRHEYDFLRRHPGARQFLDKMKACL